MANSQDDIFEFDDNSSETSENNASALSQRSFCSLKPEHYTVLEVEQVTGYRANSELFFSSTENQFYCYNTKSKLGLSYLCTYAVNKKRTCRGRMYKVEGDIFIRLNGTFQHDHAERLEEKKELFCLNEMKRRCGQLESFLSTTRLTVRDIFNQVLLE